MRGKLREGSRQVFRRLVAEKSHETFYVFGLYTADDLSSVCPAANSLEGFKKQLKVYRKTSIPCRRSARLRWRPCEWNYVGLFEYPRQEFTDVYEQMGRKENYRDCRLDLPDGMRPRFEADYYLAMILALKDLRDEQFFEDMGCGNIALIATIDDDADQEMLEITSAEFLQETECANRMLAQFQSDPGYGYASALDEYQRWPDRKAIQFLRRDLGLDPLK